MSNYLKGKIKYIPTDDGGYYTLDLGHGHYHNIEGLNNNLLCGFEGKKVTLMEDVQHNGKFGLSVKIVLGVL